MEAKPTSAHNSQVDLYERARLVNVMQSSLIYQNKKFIETKYKDEDSLENIVKKNSRARDGNFDDALLVDAKKKVGD